jgi:hypothetical protein
VVNVRIGGELRSASASRARLTLVSDLRRVKKLDAASPAKT